MQNLRTIVAALGAAGLLTACAPGARRDLASTPAQKYIGLTVTNHNWLDVVVYVVRGASRFRLGEVVGNSSANLRIPTSLIVAGAVQLMADPIGSQESYVTDAILVSSDERVQLMVAPRMRSSTYAVWGR